MKRIDGQAWVRQRRLRAYIRRKGHLPWRWPSMVELVRLAREGMRRAALEMRQQIDDAWKRAHMAKVAREWMP